MSKNDTNLLIDEQELRDALRPYRVDRDAFELGVRRRLEAAQQTLNQKQYRDGQQSSSGDYSPWLRVAASVVPFPLLGKVASGGTQLSLGKLSFGQRLICYAALPATSLLLMVGATMFGLLLIRRAQRRPQNRNIDAVNVNAAIASWWKQFGLVVGLLCVLALVLIIAGYAVPVFVVFLSSGVLMVSLVTGLGRAGMIDRQAVGRSLIPGIAMLAQVFQIYSMSDSGIHLLDQSLVQAVLYGAAAVLATVLIFDHRSRRQAVKFSIAVAIGGVLLVGYCTRSLWNPVSQDTLKNYVESFDEAPFRSASWRQWAVPAGWLQDSGVSLNVAKPRQLLEREIAGEQNPFVLGVAFDMGLTDVNDVPHLRDLDATKPQLLSESLRDRPILSIQQTDYAIRAIAALGQLSESERDLLESRLLATLREIAASADGSIIDAFVASKLLEVLDKPCTDKSIHESVQRMLVDVQRIRFSVGGRHGGFSEHRTLNHSDALATAAAVELMQRFGVPAEVDRLSLHSYLRPSTNDYWIIDQAAVRTATKLRLTSLPELPPLTWWEYVRCEPNLWMSLMIVVLCFCATFGCAHVRGTVEVAEAPSRHDLTT